jgi:hypothetical protein
MSAIIGVSHRENGLHLLLIGLSLCLNFKPQGFFAGYFSSVLTLKTFDSRDFGKTAFGQWGRGADDLFDARRERADLASALQNFDDVRDCVLRFGQIEENRVGGSFSQLIGEESIGEDISVVASF